MSREPAPFVNVTIQSSLVAAVREVCIRKPHHQAYFIADFLERHAAALEEASLSKPSRSPKEDPTSAIVAAKLMEDDVECQLARIFGLADSLLEWKQSGDQTLEKPSMMIADFLYSAIPGATTSYVGKRISGRIHYTHINGLYPALPDLPEDKGVTSDLWDQDAEEKYMYVPDVLFHPPVEYLVSYPRSGSLFLIRVGDDHVIGVDTVGSETVGIDKLIRELVEFLVTHLIE
jgi:hypothetical protein